MEEKKEKRKKRLMKILIISAAIIFFSSLESLTLAKDRSLFEVFLKKGQIGDFNQYLNLVIVNYLFSIIIPIVISIFTLFNIEKYGLNFETRSFFYYRLFFGGMILIQIINIILQFSLSSIFYYIKILLYIFLLLAVTKKPIYNEGGK
jgi:hypothetical protein